MARKKKRASGCKRITFHRGRKAIEVTRCEGRSLSTSAKRRWKRMKRRTCRNKNSGQFKVCRR